MAKEDTFTAKEIREWARNVLRASEHMTGYPRKFGYLEGNLELLERNPHTQLKLGKVV